MKPNQTMKRCVEIALFPMEVMTVTQGPDGTFSHKGRKSIDLGGKDGGIDPVFAPFSGKVGRIVASYNSVYLLSDGPVLCADGKERLLTAIFVHDDHVQVKVGQYVKQGEHFYDEGTQGFSTGNHLHLDIAEGHYTSLTDVIANAVLPQNVLYANDTIIRRDGGLVWKTYTGLSTATVPVRRTYTVKSGDSLSRIAQLNKMTWQALYELNKQIIGANPNQIKIGQVLFLD